MIRVSTSKEGPDKVKLHVSVQDTGIGISPDDLKRLFKPFTQADGSTTRLYGGTGLGLVISKQLVALMGGQLACDSEPGQGTNFFFTVGLVVDRKAKARFRSPTHLESLQGKRILIVDDNATNRKILRHQTEVLGMKSDTAASGDEGLYKLLAAQQRGEGFDLAIVDFQMPVMHGLEFAQKTKADPAISEVPLIMLTSVGLRGDAQLAKEAGVIAYLSKPLRKSDLETTLLQVLDQTSSHGDQPLVTKHSIAESRPKFNLSILVVEDNLTNQKVASGMLRILGCRVELANNGQEAVQAFSPGKFHLVLMDCQMPVMDGYQATGAIRQLELEQGLSSGIPIIALTGHALEGAREKCLAAGMDDYLTKPYSFGKMVEILTRWFSRPIDDRSAPPLKEEEAAIAGRDQTAKPEEKVGSSPIDRGVLQSLAALQIEGDESIVARVIHAYLDGSNLLLAQIREAFDNREVERLGKAAHGLKSSSANVGAITLASMSRDVEMRCKNQSLPSDEQLIARMEAEFSA
ncbi:MAG: sensor histidine kinase, partial [Gemmatimonadales bacterium]